MSSINRSTVSAEHDLWLIGPDDLTVPLTTGLHYSRQDPFAIRMSFDTGLDKPVEWAFDRDLLAAALNGPEGIGDVRAWPSARDGADSEQILNIVLTTPAGYSRFEASAAEIEAFLGRTYELVPAGRECDDHDLDAELAEMLSQG
jgi:hypothetical protein